MFRRSAKRIQDAYFIDPNDALTNIYIVTVSDLTTQQTARYVERALSLDPGNVDVLRRSAQFAAGLRRFDDAITLGNRALARDPMCIQCYGTLASIYKDAGRYDEAEAVLRRRIALVDDVVGHHNLAFILLLQGNAQEAFEIFDGITSIEEHWLLTRALALHDLGRHDEVEDMLERFVEKYSDTDPYGVATVYAYTGDISSAISWMDKAIEEDPGGFDNEVWSPLLSSLHETPQWSQWRKDAGLDEETPAAIEFTIPDFGTE